MSPIRTFRCPNGHQHHRPRRPPYRSDDRPPCPDCGEPTEHDPGDPLLERARVRGMVRAGGNREG